MHSLVLRVPPNSSDDKELSDPGTPERNTLTRRRTWGENDAVNAINPSMTGSLDSDDDEVSQSIQHGNFVEAQGDEGTIGT